MFVKVGDPNPITTIIVAGEINDEETAASLKAVIKSVKGKQKKAATKAKKEAETK
jgi:hypothetical protein